jgi:hypothetical protein
MSALVSPPQPSIGDLPQRPGPEWQRNCGHRPSDNLKRIRVLLRRGDEPQYADELNPMAPPGWAADTTRWSLTGSPFDVAWYLPL